MSIFIGHRPDRQHLQALHNCRNDQKLVELFEKVLGETKESLVKADDTTQLFRLQGKASVLQDFLSAVDKAGEVME